VGALPTTFTGRESLSVADQLKPICVLTVYNHAVILRKAAEHGGGYVEYPVDPSDIAEAIAAKAAISTGLLTSNTLWVGQSGTDRTVIEYRPPQVTGLWLEGSEEAVRIPLPPLVLVRHTRGNQNPTYELYAVLERPQSEKDLLYVAPLPHVSSGVCWGTVQRPSESALRGNSLEEDWRNFLGSKFGNHTVENKSKRQPKDIRKLYFELHGRADTYPIDDLIPLRQGKWEKHLSDLFKVGG
jgi:E2/UBC family protein D